MSAQAQAQQVRTSQQRKAAQVERHRAYYQDRQRRRAASPTGGKPVGLPQLIQMIAEQVKALVIRKVVVEVLSFITEMLERWLADAPVKPQGKRLLRELNEPEGKELLHAVAEQFV